MTIAHAHPVHATLHLYRCFAHSTDDFVLVEARSHTEAARVAAERRGWAVKDVITRYQISRSAVKR